MNGRPELTIGRDYCRGCKTTSTQRYSGWATALGAENSIRPRAFYRQCDTCGTSRLVLGNVNDAEGLCRVVLKAWLDKTGGGRSGATSRPFGDGSLDADDGLAFLQTEVWRLYLAWQPEQSAGSFLAYASELLPRRLASWSRDASGEASTRAKGRRFPKAHAASVSLSLDALTAGGTTEDGGETRDDILAGQTRGVHAGAGAFTPDHADAGSSDLLRVLTAGSGRGVGRDRGARDAAPQRPSRADPADRG